MRHLLLVLFCTSLMLVSCRPKQKSDRRQASTEQQGVDDRLNLSKGERDATKVLWAGRLYVALNHGGDGWCNISLVPYQRAPSEFDLLGITSASCFVDDDYPGAAKWASEWPDRRMEVNVRIGDINTLTAVSKELEERINDKNKSVIRMRPKPSDVIFHPKFKGSGQNYDVAVIKLRVPPEAGLKAQSLTKMTTVPFDATLAGSLNKAISNDKLRALTSWKWGGEWGGPYAIALQVEMMPLSPLGKCAELHRDLGPNLQPGDLLCPNDTEYFLSRIDHGAPLTLYDQKANKRMLLGVAGSRHKGNEFGISNQRAVFFNLAQRETSEWLATIGVEQVMPTDFQVKDPIVAEQDCSDNTPLLSCLSPEARQAYCGKFRYPPKTGPKQRTNRDSCPPTLCQWKEATSNKDEKAPAAGKCSAK